MYLGCFTYWRRAQLVDFFLFENNCLSVILAIVLLAGVFYFATYHATTRSINQICDLFARDYAGVHTVGVSSIWSIGSVC